MLYNTRADRAEHALQYPYHYLFLAQHPVARRPIYGLGSGGLFIFVLLLTVRLRISWPNPVSSDSSKRARRHPDSAIYTVTVRPGFGLSLNGELLI